MTAQIFTTGDEGFPAITTVADVITALKAALITGYGSKTSAGWELLYDSTANASDTSNRLVVRSKSPASEQMVYELCVDGSSIKINAYKSFDAASKAGVAKWHSTYLVTINLSRKKVDILADDKICYVAIHGAWAFFGDFVPHNSQYTQSICHGHPSSTADTGNALTLPSTTHTSNEAIVDKNGVKYYCRSYISNEEYGFGSRIGYNNSVLFGFVLRDGDVPLLYKTELMCRANGKWCFAGYLPYLFYCDVGIAETTTIIDGQPKRVIDSSWYHSGGLYWVI